jgi:hypothetical protein
LGTVAAMQELSSSSLAGSFVNPQLTGTLHRTPIATLQSISPPDAGTPQVQISRLLPSSYEADLSQLTHGRYHTASHQHFQRDGERHMVTPAAVGYARACEPFAVPHRPSCAQCRLVAAALPEGAATRTIRFAPKTDRIEESADWSPARRQTVARRS